MRALEFDNLIGSYLAAEASIAGKWQAKDRLFIIVRTRVDDYTGTILDNEVIVLDGEGQKVDRLIKSYADRGDAHKAAEWLLSKSKRLADPGAVY